MYFSKASLLTAALFAANAIAATVEFRALYSAGDQGIKNAKLVEKYDNEKAQGILNQMVDWSDGDYWAEKDGHTGAVIVEPNDPDKVEDTEGDAKAITKDMRDLVTEKYHVGAGGNGE